MAFKKKTILSEDENVIDEELSETTEDLVEEKLEVEDSEAEEETKVNEKLEKSLLKKQAKEEKNKEKQKEKLKKQRLKEIKNGGNVNIVRYEPDINVGLTDEQVQNRLDEELNNKSHMGSTKSIKKIIFTNVFTFFNILTLAIAGWLVSIKAFTDLFFMVIVTANVVIGIIQEIKAKNIIDKLSLLSAPTANVVRESSEKEIAVTDIVLDDILLLSSGKQIPSDSIVVDGSVEVNESLLTGESDAIVKKPGDTLFSGSFVVSGTCRARVDKVGKDNYIEQLSSEAKLYKKPKSDLLRSLNIIILVMAFIIIPIGAVLFYMQFVRNGIDYYTAVRKTAGAMIGMIPSGLYLLSSVALAVGVIRLAQNKVMVQELYCIEMLARVNVLCLDKTGTITDGTMSVKNIIEFNNVAGLSTKNVISAMLNALNESNLTSVALEEKFGRAKRIKYKETIPFSSQRKFNAVTFERLGTFILGAPEFVMKDKYPTVKKEVEHYASLGYRVLLLAHKAGNIENGVLPNDPIEVVSMILIEDNIRPDAIKTISYFKQSGVEVKVISGDNPLTVSKISERAGIENASEYISLDGMKDEDVIRAATKYTVFGRVSPAQKRLLVRTLKEAGKTVAMTGDGVNDILALKEADCSIAVASGSEAARNVSHLVLLDSNFDSMPKVVAEGRRVINNVSGVACLFLTKTIFSFLLAIQAINSGGVYPISTNQLIMIDFLVTGMPSFFLVLEPNNKEVDGRFITNILKGAIPGAVAILISSYLAFALVSYQGLDFLTSSTIIVIMATHTCLMVLFKVCRPFNLLHKAICGTSYTLFVLLIIFAPNFFEFRPIFKFMEYYSDSIVTKSLAETPSIAISEDWYYVLDGQMTDTPAKVDSTQFITTASSDGYLIIDGTQTEWKIPTPILSADENNILYLKGYATNIAKFVTPEVDLSLDIKSDGTVTINKVDVASGQIIGHYEIADYTILPTVRLNNDKIVIAGYNYDFDGKEITSIEAIKEEDGTYVLGINGTKFLYATEDGNMVPYKLDVPAISYNAEDKIVLGGEATQYNITEDLGVSGLGELTEEDITIRGSSYLVKGKSTNCTIETPDIEASVAGRYVIDGRYTTFEAEQIGGDTSTELNFTEDGYLTINNVVTDYKVKIQETVGGTVQRLSIPALLILFTLCLLASPLMRLLQSIVPWIKRAYHNVQYLISKF